MGKVDDKFSSGFVKFEIPTRQQVWMQSRYLGVYVCSSRVRCGPERHLGDICVCICMFRYGHICVCVCVCACTHV